MRVREETELARCREHAGKVGLVGVPGGTIGEPVRLVELPVHEVAALLTHFCNRKRELLMSKASGFRQFLKLQSDVVPREYFRNPRGGIKVLQLFLLSRSCRTGM